MRRLSLIPLLLLSLAVIGGCSTLNFVKQRLPPPTQTPDGVIFRFYAPSAQVVQLMGNWPENNWGNGQAENAAFIIGEMTDDDGDGIWERVENLPPGRYQYKFKIDRLNWKEDPNNPNRTDDGFGGFNSLLDVR